MTYTLHTEKTCADILDSTSNKTVITLVITFSREFDGFLHYFYTINVDLQRNNVNAKMRAILMYVHACNEFYIKSCLMGS
jgi:hypothetical protein